MEDEEDDEEDDVVPDGNNTILKLNLRFLIKNL